MSVAAPAHRVLMVGLGGVGGLIAATLSRGGFDVAAVVRSPERRWALRAHGLEASGLSGGDLRVHLGALSASLEEAAQGGPYDAVLLATQNDALGAVVPRLAPLLAADTPWICLQNGLAEERVATMLVEVGVSGQVHGAVLSFGAEVRGPTRVAQTARGGVTLGSLESSAVGDALLAALAEALERSWPVRSSENLRGVRWSKLALNCATTALGVISGERLGRTLLRRAGRRLALEVIAEVVTVAQAEGVRLEAVAGTLDLPWLAGELERVGLLGLLLRHGLLLAVGARYHRLRSSMLAAVERGQEPAIEHLNGEVVRRAEALGLEAPRNAALRALVWSIARGEARSAPEHLETLLAQPFAA